MGSDDIKKILEIGELSWDILISAIKDKITEIIIPYMIVVHDNLNFDTILWIEEICKDLGKFDIVDIRSYVDFKGDKYYIKIKYKE